jgi:uncharacterized membrane protein SpoIIM required for sporulation
MGLDRQKSYLTIIILAVCFLAGVFAGAFVSQRVSGDTSDYLSGLILGTYDADSYQPVSVGRALINSLLFPAAVFLLSFTVFGVACIPLALCARAFFLSFTVAAFIGAFGSSGPAVAFFSLGLQNLLSLPCLFILAVQGVASSASVVSVFSGGARKPGGFYGRKPLFRAAVCLALCAASALLEVYLVPSLFSAFAVNLGQV